MTATAETTTRTSLLAVVRNPNLRRLQLAALGSVIGEGAYATAITVYAFLQGGATTVSLFLTVRLVTAAVVGPLGAAHADRTSRKTFMMALDAARAVLVCVSALAITLGGPPLVVYVVGVVVTALGPAFRAAQAGLVPTLVSRPSELTATNAVAGNIENAGSFVGPALGGALVLWVGASAAVWLNVGTWVWSLVMISAVVLPSAMTSEPTAPEPDETATDEPGRWRELAAGFTLVARDGDLRTVTMLGSAQVGLFGALVVYLAVLAERVLPTGVEGLGFLTSVMGIAGTVGSVLVLARIAAGRLGQDLLVGTVGWVLPVLVLGFAPVPAVLIAAVALVGFSDALVNLGLDTIPQRLTPEHLMSRVYAAIDSVLMAAAAGCTLLAAPLLQLLGLRGSLIAFGGAAGVVVLASARRVRLIDARLAEPEGLDLLREVPMLAPLPPPVLEQLAQSLEVVEVGAGGHVVREGDVSDRFFLIAEGRVEVTQGERTLREEGVGEVFGEVGLLRDVVRTATVSAVTDVRLLVLGRGDFLAAVTGSGPARHAAEDLVLQRIGR